ncbi:hypothetical protein HPB48_021378 [Haemaphysalis longicornis]|uniref:Transposable element P transposase-like GTP-binding insertion domain-containing protein n=1 Tax=Haemaphysalis longicornis TaxID=44386 RepID=A0A9J6FUL4_HAELO|nr:hypothetical protein HPB48_021378 [Haemaphysalis longicornis]
MPPTAKKKTQRWCFVPGCDGGYKSCGQKVSLFRAPARKDEFENGHGPYQGPTSCYKRILRFAKDISTQGTFARISTFLYNTLRFVMKNFVHIVDGKEVFMPRDVPALKEGAVPTVFPNLPKYMTKTLPKERKRRVGQSSSVPAKKSRRDIDNSACESVEPTPDDELDTTDEVPVKHFIFGLQLPSEYWSRQTFQHQNVACYQTAEYHKNKVPPVAFNKVAVFEVEAQTSPSCTIFLAGQLHCRRTIQSEKDAQELLVYAEKLSVVLELERPIKELPKKQQHAVRACFEACKRKSLRGFRYEKAWLLECIILRMKSPRLYEHLRSHKILVLPSRVCLQKYIKAHWEHVSTTWKTDSSALTLRAAPKLTRSHIYPSGFEKMRVNLAFNVFNKTVVHAMDLHKEEIERQYKNLEPTRVFIDVMAQTIEAMTSRFPAEALRCISFYSLARSPKGGNVSPGLLESLLSEEQLLPENETADDTALPGEAAEVAVDHVGYVEERSDARLVYYVAGYVARKRILLTDCKACKDACLVTRESVPHQLPAEACKQWDMGGLLYPSVCLYNLIQTLENRLTHAFSTTRLHTKVVKDLLLLATNVPQIGCINSDSEKDRETARECLVSRRCGNAIPGAELSGQLANSQEPGPPNEAETVNGEATQHWLPSANGAVAVAVPAAEVIEQKGQLTPRSPYLRPAKRSDRHHRSLGVAVGKQGASVALAPRGVLDDTGCREEPAATLPREEQSDRVEHDAGMAKMPSALFC